MDSGPEQPEPTNEIRPEAERPEAGENEVSGKSELQTEFERAEVEKEIGVKGSAETVERTELQEIQEVSERATVGGEAEVAPGPEPE